MQEKRDKNITDYSTLLSSEILANTIVDAISEKKGKRIVKLDMRKLPKRAADFFVICEAVSGTQSETIADFIEEKAREKLSLKPSGIEGLQQKQWVLIDFFDVVAHVFTEETRSLYRLEELWADAEITIIEDE